jgi:16S rRNA (cytosine967-C5)-methyltransferase
MRSHSHLNTASKIIQTYDGSIPFASWLKQFFKAEKKFGSTDRKQIAHLCYCYYRLGQAFNNLETEERLLTGVFLCSFSANKVLEELKSEWNEKIALSPQEKLDVLAAAHQKGSIFDFPGELSDEIDREGFALSFLLQPDLFLRIRPGREKPVIHQLQDAGIFYQQQNNCLRLNNQTKVEEWLHIDRDVVIQDASSQKVLDPLGRQLPPDQQLSVWDCCAASGGKSILMVDLFQNIQLTVSDVRESILTNLRKRFQRAGISHYNSFVADVSADNFSIRQDFDVVICDAPCSGSGTWARTPEQLYFFKKEKISYYAALQKRIATRAAKQVREGGYLVYITCSVFSKENEEVVEFLQGNTGLSLCSKEYIKGYDQKADTLFTALFKMGG